jgi:serine/threonine protein kinase
LFYQPSNVLLGEVGDSSDIRCVIADFGIATPGRIRLDSAGTPSFMAPEVCSGEAHDGRLADCYSLGATVYCIRVGRPPFVGKGNSKNQKLMDLHHQIKHKPLWFPIPMNNELKSLISGLMEKDPRKRMPLSEAMRHAWLVKRPVEDVNIEGKF